MSSKPKSVWQHLLKVPGKDVLTKLCHQAILYRGLGSDLIPDAVIAGWSSTLSITKGEAKQVIVHLSALLQKAVFVCAANPANVANSFPDDFHKELRELITAIIVENFSEWKSALAASNTTLPRLVDVDCRIDQPADSAPMDSLTTAQVNCILRLKIQDNGSVERTEPARTVDIQLSKEKLNTMLDGLSKIRDQLTSVTQR